MTKGQIFKKAHTIAKELKIMFKNYRVAFSVALKRVYRELRSQDTEAVIAIKKEAEELLQQVLTVSEVLGGYYKKLRRKVRKATAGDNYFGHTELENEIKNTAKNMESMFTYYIDKEVTLYDKLKEHKISEVYIESTREVVNDIIGFYNSTYKLIDKLNYAE